MSTAQPNGFIFYRGPSMLDGSPIVAIATGTARGSRNTKTGHEVQTWILRDDMSPVDAVKTGADGAICGACSLRGNGDGTNRTCYVTVFQAPLVVWKAAQRGLYPFYNPTTVIELELLTGRMLRLGSYGDPAAVPAHVWETLVHGAAGHTGYTHQWATKAGASLQSLCMASADSDNDARVARELGWRTFRVMRRDEQPAKGEEISCPASKEAGAKTSCALCKACGGTSAKARVSIAIQAHGAASKVNAFNQ